MTDLREEIARVLHAVDEPKGVTPRDCRHADAVLEVFRSYLADEATVEAAAQAIFAARWDNDWMTVHDSIRRTFVNDAAAALSVLVPQQETR